MPSNRLVASCVAVLASWAVAQPCEAYVWNQVWTPVVKASVKTPPQSVTRLRVLVAEVGEKTKRVAIDRSLLAADWVAVVRVTSSALPPVSAIVSALKGLDAPQVELDVDSPRGQLGAYAAWLGTLKPLLGGRRLSITALPTWTGAPELESISSLVDDWVLQVHTIRAPELFNSEQAIRDVKAFPELGLKPFHVALPAYRVRTKDGSFLAANPSEVAGVLARTRTMPSVAGTIFFRLGNEADFDAWGAKTLETICSQLTIDAHVSVEVRKINEGGSDVFVVNVGNVDAQAPERVVLSGATIVEGSNEYVHEGSALRRATPLWLAPGASRRIGFARGTTVSVAP